MTSNDFNDNVKKWLIVDNQIKKLNETAKMLRNNKSDLTHSICGYLETNNITDKSIKVANTQLKYCNRKDYSPLTFDYIEKCLYKIINKEEDVKYIIQYLKENREIKNVQDIRRNDIK